MGLQEKEVVESFYESFFTSPEAIRQYLHKNVRLEWQSSTDFRKMTIQDIVDFSRELNEAYSSVRIKIMNVIGEENQVAIRYSYFGQTIENPNEELELGHFIAIWELKEEKLYRGFQISHPAGEANEVID